MYRRLTSLFRDTYALYTSIDDVFEFQYITKYVPYVLEQILLIIAPLFGVAMIVGLIVNFVQVGWKPSFKPLKPKFSRLNPIQGFKKLFSPRSLIELFKAMIKVAIISAIIYQYLSKEIENIFLLLDMSIMESVRYIGNLAINIGLKIGMFFIFMAVADYAYQRYEHEKSLKMTKEEVKEEHKMSEGNPQVKSKIRQKMREVSMRRMMQDIPKADVVITNPTHYAIAIQYDADVASAPIVLAKGVDYLAQRIKSVAQENEIQMVENRPLARALYQTVDIGQEVPPELYQAVAEVLAFVYGLKNK
jgi:flagellar biosynthetic protein FlhB